MKNAQTKKSTSNLPKIPSIFRTRDLEILGIERQRLRIMLEQDEVEQLSRGLYRLKSVEPTEQETIVALCARTPQAILCLLSALQIHEIGTQTPSEVWIALDRKARKPRFDHVRVRVVRFSGQMLNYGVETREIQGVKVRLTSPARTVIDCFRYRNKTGKDVALEALQDALRTGKVTIEGLVRAAEVCRIITVIRPYLEAIL